MKNYLGFALSTAVSFSAVAKINLDCTWKQHGNPRVQIEVDQTQNTASAELIDGISAGKPAIYNCHIQPSCSAAPNSVVTLLCMGPQLAPGVGQVLTTFMVDLIGKTAAVQNTMVRASGLTPISSLPSVQCQ